MSIKTWSRCRRVIGRTIRDFKSKRIAWRCRTTKSCNNIKRRIYPVFLPTLTSRLNVGPVRRNLAPKKRLKSSFRIMRISYPRPSKQRQIFNMKTVVPSVTQLSRKLQCQIRRNGLIAGSVVTRCAGSAGGRGSLCRRILVIRLKKCATPVPSRSPISTTQPSTNKQSKINKSSQTFSESK